MTHFSIRTLTITTAATLLLSLGIHAQVVDQPPAPPAPTVRIERLIPSPKPAPRPLDEMRFRQERTIDVSPTVTVSFCVVRGDVKVNGWSRNEVRVLVDGGTRFDYKVMQKNAASGIAEWIMIVRAPEQGERPGVVNECLSGGDIEIDAPVGSSISTKGDDATFSIDRTRKASVRNAGGDITIRNVTDGVAANTFRGDIFVESSRGGITLDSASGNVVVFESSPSDIGDIFKAKTTGGSISLQRIGHRQMDVYSIAGSVAFEGGLVTGGSYSFGTSNGTIKLALPSDTSAQVQAIYAFGRFESEFPLKVVTENLAPGSVKRIVGQIGDSGGSTLRLTTNSGGISIKKQ
jgi:hypothetical protein